MSLRETTVQVRPPAWRIRRVAGLLLLPYLLWVGFASVLTWTLWRSNPGLL